MFKAVSIIVLLLFTNVIFFSHAYGDGLASETLPPSVIGSKNVTLTINSSPFLIDSTHTGTQINFVVIDADTKQPFPQDTIAVSAFKGDKALFGHIFKSDGGNFLINLIPKQSGNITVTEKGGILSGIVGEHGGTYDVSGPAFNEGGLYKFKIELLTMGSYSNQVSKSYNAGISIPETNNYTVYDNEYGKQTVTFIAYYDTINDFKYDTNSKTITFDMPFDWSADNVNQVTVVHQEIKIPKSFGDFIVTKYDVDVNGKRLDNKAISIDDYSSDERIVHLILYKEEVDDLAKEQKNPKPEMDFSISPSNETNFPIQQYTRNAQYKVSLSWDPPKIYPGTTTKFDFQILDPYLINKTVDSLDYDFSVIEGQSNVIMHKTGKTNSDGSMNSIDVPFPLDYTGPITIAFENLDKNSFADAEFSGIVMRHTSVPEFPLGAIIVMISLFASVILIPRIIQNKIRT